MNNIIGNLEMETTKNCLKCGVNKPLTEYHKDLKCKDGKAIYCAECRRTYYGKKYRDKIKNRPPNKMDSNKGISYFIEQLNLSDEYIRHIYTNGGCYKFHVLLSRMFKGCTPHINQHMNHIITRYKGNFYDINGLVEDCHNYKKLPVSYIPMVSKWSFYMNNLLVLKDCPHCDEPIIIKNLTYEKLH
jgi:hypothetical protein